MVRKLFLLAALCVSLAGPLRAQDREGRWGLGGAVGAGDFLSPKGLGRATDPDAAAGAWLRRGASAKTEWLLAFDNLSGAGDASTPGARLHALSGGVRRFLGDAEGGSPFVDLGGGIGFGRGLSSTRRRTSAPVARAALGFERPWGESLALSVQGQYVQTWGDSRFTRDAGAYSATAGLTWFFHCDGYIPPKAPPAPVAAPKPIPPPDADGDDVPDARDECPNTPAGTPVDGVGCPRDSDGDGVTDDKDRCPNTPRGALINEEGCPVERVSVTLEINFDSGRDAVKPSFEPELKRLAEFLKRFPETTTVIEGHTDNVGRPAANRALSQKRADAVRNHLLFKFGVTADRVSAKGFGPDSPVANNATPDGRAANRRVVATVSAIKKK
ncbi:MAG: OmpA family protein [Elusimicrobia bacterium]|nr:OmpA family protein [Elusimicrobiota bacterium]MBK7207545.1 OmpA family protein [Elusimicrobiota bacterium]MBK7544315.1 OmpA family protein [Elusimicrobiota bacterium]MBK7573837.1 OmpA family protein [Elusimicrobiota bacterium]MBK7689435.1 OmpA family protein [Elusimicrobiota bacterium]